MTPGYAAVDSHGDSDKTQVLARLRRVEGQVRGLQRMVQDDTYCIDVLTQLAAVTKALQGVGLQLLDNHLQHCVAGAAADGRRTDELVHEATKAVGRLLRS
jgi:CsoR family transcriptional regulator, copper-sensing transcriptional repressor